MYARLSTTLCVGFTSILALGLAGVSLIINYTSARSIWTDDASGLTWMLWPAAAAGMDAMKFVVMAVMASRWDVGSG